jgi:hypothetical protein
MPEQMHTVRIAPILFCLILGGCTPTPDERQTATSESLKDYVASIEDSLRLGSTVNWKEADRRMEIYCAVPAAGISTGRVETDEQEFDRQIGRYWALRVKHMTLQEAQDLLERKGRTIEGFLDALE